MGGRVLDVVLLLNISSLQSYLQHVGRMTRSLTDMSTCGIDLGVGSSGDEGFNDG